MSHYNHLTLSERELILYFLAKGFSISKIALKIGRSKSTISR
ncbi:helix-turn-helix domain-containing protein, partial [Anaerotignum lactatifermentans]|nr:helix-turn-helix domain-containing protein [Anaerotignum lactatifermentans]